MSSAEYKELKGQLDRIERMLAQLSGGNATDLFVPAVQERIELPQLTPEMSEAERKRAIQAEGHYILETQGMAAYKAFWKQQSKKHKLSRAA